MKLKDVRTAIYSKLDEALRPYSFKLNKSREAFVRKVPEGRQSIYVSVVDLEPTFEFSIVIGLRADPVEEISHLFSGASEKYQNLSETAIVQLSYFTSQEETNYLVSSTRDIDSVTAVVSTILREKVLPVLDECTNIAALEARVNSPQRNFDSSQPPYSFLTSLVLASLVNSDAFEGLALEATNSVSQYPESERDKIARMIVHLKAQKKIL